MELLRVRAREVHGETAGYRASDKEGALIESDVPCPRERRRAKSGEEKRTTKGLRNGSEHEHRGPATLMYAIRAL